MALAIDTAQHFCLHHMYSGVLQSGAVCYRVLQSVSECCSALQCVAVCRSVLQCVAVFGSVLQCVAFIICIQAFLLWRS